VELSADMTGKCSQEWVGFLSARGGLSRVKGVEVPETGPVAMNMVIEEDDQEVLADQRACPDNWSRNYINRAVLVGTPIHLDSNTSIKDKRPQYFTASQGERDSFLSAECL